MKSQKIWSILFGLCLCMTLSCNAQGRNWSALYAFGDSFTDTGVGYVDGNGPTAVAYLASSLGIPFTYAGDPNSGHKSLNFAVSGATTGKGDGMLVRPATARCGSKESLLGRGMRTQVLDFAQRVKSGSLRFNPEKTLFFLAGGLNDHQLPMGTSIANLEGEVRLLYDLGGRYFMIAQLPTKIPAFADIGVRLNTALLKVPADLRAKLPGIHIESSKWGEYFDQVIENPGKYSIVNTTDRCAGRALFGEESTPCPAPDTYFYFHRGHPSTVVHRFVAAELKREITEVFP
jgi:hypothetical protein